MRRFNGWQGAIVKADRIRPCKVCGAPVTDRKMTVRYCSPKCWYSTQRGILRKPKQLKLRLRRTVPAQMVPCITCGKEFLLYASAKNRRACSFKCAIPLLYRQVQVKCSNCGKEFTRGHALVKRAKKVFCDQECAWTFARGENAPTWRGGQPKHYRGSDWTAVSEAARSRDGYKCQVCGRPQQKGQKLSVDHIIPYRIVKENALVNLISICRAPCHAVKTQVAERCFLRGDMLGFMQNLTETHWPMGKVQAAIQYWGQL